MLAFPTIEIAEECRNLFKLEQAQVIPLSELERFTASPLGLHEQALVFDSLAHIQSMHSAPDSFPFASFLVQLPSQ